MIAKIGDWVKRHRRDLWIGLCIALATWSAFNVGRARGLQEAHIASQSPEKTDPGSETPRPPSITIRTKSIPPVRTDLRVVASKSSSSKKYHFTWCPGASKIKGVNKIWFDTETAAQAKGYTLAGNCTR
jgi:hypothetical protein